MVWLVLDCGVVCIAQFRVTRFRSRQVGSAMMAEPSASVTKKVATAFFPLYCQLI